MEKKTYIFNFRGGEEKEVIFRGKESLMDAVEKFKKEGKEIVDMGPKMNPLEELFLDLLQKDA